MARNFSIRKNKGAGPCRIELAGDFDGTSAHMLLNCLARMCRKNVRVVVDTGHLGRLSRYGLELFRKRMSLAEFSARAVTFTGDNACHFT